MRVSSARPFLTYSLILLVLIAVAGVPLWAQMVTGPDMTNFGEALGLTPALQTRSYTVEELSAQVAEHCSANVLLPGESVRMTLLFRNKTNRPIHAQGSLEVIQFGTKGKPGDVWSPAVFRIARYKSSTLRVDLGRGGSQRITIAPAIPEAFGGYALIADLGSEGRAFAAALVRVLKPDSGRVQLPTYALDFTWDEQMNENVLDLFQKLGIKGARTGAGFALEKDPGYTTHMAPLEHYLEWARKHEVTVMLTVDNGAAPMPLGRPRPWLSDDAHMLKTKDDRAWLPAYDDQFEQWISQLVSRFGWPRGPVNAVELWNEPWEGISISGWGADIPRFRDIYRHMAEGVQRARAESGVKVLIGGACSSTNTRDKLFPDSSNEFLKWLDFVSIHYQPLSADPALVPDWMNRKGPYGRVKVWDTESWIANSEDRVAGVIASMRAQGQDRTAGIYDGNVYESRNLQVEGKTYPVVQAWPPAAAVAASQKFIGQRAFSQILFKNGLPWVFVFDGLSSPDDGTLVVLGDLGSIYDRSRTLFRSVMLKPNATLTLRGQGDEFALYDFYGNRLKTMGQQITVPLNGLGYFLRTDNSAGSFAKLVQAVRSARITGYDPVEIVLHDFTAPIEMKPALLVKMTNVLNRPVYGALAIESDQLHFGGNGQKLRLEMHETREIAVPMTDGATNESNMYRVAVRFNAGVDGFAQHTENLHANVISKRAIHVDGNLADWSGVLPQPVADLSIAPSLTEEAWLPFMQLRKGTRSGMAVGYLAYDEKNFYFAAKISDDTPDEGMDRFADRNDDAFFYPEKVWDEAGKELDWPAGVRRFSYRKNFEIPSGNNHDNVQIAFNVLPPSEKALLEFPAGTMPHFEVYADTDYEFALNPVASRYGGGTEVWRLLAPGMPRKHFFPRQPKAPNDGGPVPTAKLVMRRDGNLRIVEAAIPWTEVPAVKACLDHGRTIKFSYRVNNNSGAAMELAAGRSVSKENALTFHDDWSTHWANELEFGFEK
jgi:hypothetical protein